MTFHTEFTWENRNLLYTSSEYCHYSLVLVHGHHMQLCVYVQERLRTQDPLQYTVCEQRIQSYIARPFSGGGSYHMQYKTPAKPPSMVLYATQLSICVELFSRPTIACSICMLHITSYFFYIELWSIQLLLWLFTFKDLSLAATTIHNTHNSQLQLQHQQLQLQ